MNSTYLIIALVSFIIIAAAFIFLFVASKAAKLPPYLEEPKTRVVNVFGYNIHYTREGKGPTLLLIHGIGASHYVWRDLVPYLKDHFTLVSIDLLGFGFSDKPSDFLYDLDSQTSLVLEFLRKLNLKSTYLLGSSMGGAICLRLAQVHPEMFPKIATLSPAADPSISLFDLNRLSFVSPFVSPLVGERFVKEIMKRVNSNSKKISPDTVKMYSRHYTKQNAAVHSFIKSFALLRDRRIFDDLVNVKQPVLILWGKKDRIIPVKFAGKIISKLPFAKLEIHESAGHHIQEDEPEWVSKKLLEFFV